MTKEFKKIINKNETRYVLEDASAGATSSVSIAAVESPLGPIRRRIKKIQEKIETVKVPVKQKQPQGHPQTQTGAGRHQNRPQKAKSGSGAGHKDFNKFHGEGVAEGNRDQDRNWKDEAEQELSSDKNSPYYVFWTGQYMEEGRPKGDGGNVVAINIKDKEDADELADQLNRQYKSGNFPDKMVYANRKDGTYIDYHGAYSRPMRKMDSYEKEMLKYDIRAGDVKDYSKQGVAEDFDSGEYNDEAGMFKNDLQTLIRVSSHLEKEISDDENLPEWCQTKIATARSMVVTVMDYILSQHENGIQPDQDVEENYRYRYQGRDPEQLAGWADDPNGKNDWVLWIINNKTKKSRPVKRWPALSTSPPTAAKNYQAVVEKNAAARGEDISTMLRLEAGQSYNEGVAEAHPNSNIYDNCWSGYRKVPGKKRGEDGSCKKIKNESVDEYFDKLNSALKSKLL